MTEIKSWLLTRATVNSPFLCNCRRNIKLGTSVETVWRGSSHPHSVGE